jgi:hypothetical protein
MRWQYHAMRIPSREWLDRDLPLQDVQLGPALSGPYSLKATIAPEFQSLVADDGELLLAEWGTLIIAEADDVIRGAAILTTPEIVGSVLTLDCVGISAFAAGQEFEGTLTWGGPTAGLTGHGVDALDEVRGLWGWLQDQPDGGLGVVLGDTATPYVRGAWHNARRIADDGSLGPANEIADPIVFDGVWTNSSRKPAAATGKSVFWQHSIGWWEKVDIGARMDELARTVPFDYVETAAWTDPAKSDVRLGIEFGYPRLGAKRPNLAFLEGENVTAQVPIKRGRDGYANHITAHGAGEGAKQLRGSASRRDGRLRRAASIEAATLTSTAALRSLAADTLLRRRHLADITAVSVANHPSAPIGSYSVGDDVLVQTGPSWQPTTLWVRITALDIDPVTETTTITCSRSDAWDYAGGAA